MARTSNVYARVEPNIKEQAEFVLDQLGIPMSNAIGMFLRQVVIHRGIKSFLKLILQMIYSRWNFTNRILKMTIFRITE